MSIFKEDFKTAHGIFGSSSLVEQIFKVNVEGRKPIMDLYNISVTVDEAEEFIEWKMVMLDEEFGGDLQ